MNSFVFAADGVLQGASEFRYQAGSMALSVAIAILTFVGLETVAATFGIIISFVAITVRVDVFAKVFS